MLFEPPLPDVSELSVDEGRECLLTKPFEQGAYIIRKFWCDKFLECVFIKQAKLILITVHKPEPETE